MLALVSACDATAGASDENGESPAPPSPAWPGEPTLANPERSPPGEPAASSPDAPPIDPAAGVRGICRDAPALFQPMTAGAALDGVAAWSGPLPAVRWLEGGYYFAFFESESCGRTAVVTFAASSLTTDTGDLYELSPGLRWAVTDLPEQQSVRLTLAYGEPGAVFPPAGSFTTCARFERDGSIVNATCGETSD